MVIRQPEIKESKSFPFLVAEAMNPLPPPREQGAEEREYSTSGLR